jgi:uncharacterized Zn finger protein
MVKAKLPQLTESHVRKLASEKSFERGKNYYRDEAILEPVRQGMELRAYSEGSDYEPYQVSAMLAKNGIAETSCTCPYDHGGICKHVVALLLTYVHNPQAFRAIPPLKELLAERSKEELVTIISEMIKREPELMSVVELSAVTQQAHQGKTIDVAAFRRQARRAMQSDNSHAIEKELQALQDAAARLAKSGDSLNAGAIYHALLDEAVRHYDDMMFAMDEDGDIAILVDAFAEGLSQCLKKSKADNQTRRAWLETLLKAELADIKQGGIDLAPSARKAILKLSTNEEWEWLEKLVSAEIESSNDWARGVLAEFLAEGKKRQR